MNVMFLICAINYRLVQVSGNIPNEVEMDKKYTPYNHKVTKIDRVEPKHCGTPTTKRGLSNQQCVSSLQFRDSVIQLPEL